MTISAQQRRQYASRFEKVMKPIKLGTGRWYSASVAVCGCGGQRVGNSTRDSVVSASPLQPAQRVVDVFHTPETGGVTMYTASTRRRRTGLRRMAILEQINQDIEHMALQGALLIIFVGPAVILR